MAIFKILLSGIIIWLVTEFGKRSSVLGGLILSLPVTSIIALVWLWFESKDANKVAMLSKETMIFILPSFVFFILVWLMLSRGISFYATFATAIASTMGAYALFFKMRGEL